jgi:cytochrome o ubiquinol oxidase operon protein cyoD
MKMSPSLRRDFTTYAVGYLLAIFLTSLSFSSVFFHLLPPGRIFILILVLAVMQMIVHMRCFLHVSLQRSARINLHLILFSAAIILLMVGGTLVILFNEQARMM